MKGLLQRVVPFLLSFLLGISAVSFYISKENRVITRPPLKLESQSTFFNPPQTIQCVNTFPDLIKKRMEIIKWFLANKNAPQKQKLAKEKALRDLELQIKVLQNLEEFQKKNSDEKGLVMDLLYREKCYQF